MAEEFGMVKRQLLLTARTCGGEGRRNGADRARMILVLLGPAR